MMVRGIVDTEIKKDFPGGKVLREVKILEKFLNGKQDFVWVQVWGSNGVDTSEGASIDLEVRMKTETFTRKDGSTGSKTKLIAMV